MEPNEINLEHATSLDNGMRLMSCRHEGYYCIATVNENGDIKTEWTNRKFKRSIDLASCVLGVLFIIFFLTITINVYLWQCENYGFLLFSRISLISLFCYLLVRFISFAFIKSKTSNVLMFHSAKHMMVNAYKDLKRIPSLDELRHFSRFSSFCSTNDLALYLSAISFIYICTFISQMAIEHWFCLMVTFCIFVAMAFGFGWVNFLQVFTTKLPADRELSVSIAALTTWLENEQKD